MTSRFPNVKLRLGKLIINESEITSNDNTKFFAHMLHSSVWLYLLNVYRLKCRTFKTFFNQFKEDPMKYSSWCHQKLYEKKRSLNHYRSIAINAVILNPCTLSYIINGLAFCFSVILHHAPKNTVQQCKHALVNLSLVLCITVHSHLGVYTHERGLRCIYIFVRQ